MLKSWNVRGWEVDSNLIFQQFLISSFVSVCRFNHEDGTIIFTFLVSDKLYKYLCEYIAYFSFRFFWKSYWLFAWSVIWNCFYAVQVLHLCLLNWRITIVKYGSLMNNFKVFVSPAQTFVRFLWYFARLSIQVLREVFSVLVTERVPKTTRRTLWTGAGRCEEVFRVWHVATRIFFFKKSNWYEW
jgi:hypothetical protein